MSVSTRNSGENRAAILRAGYEAIATLGYQGATTAEIQRRAQVSSGTFFHYFPTKEDLLLALLAEAEPATETPSLERQIEQRLAEAGDPLLPAFALEISRLSALPRLRQSLDELAQRRTQDLTAAIAAEQDACRVREDRSLADLVLTVEVIIGGFEQLAATRGLSDAEAETETVRELITEALAWEPGDAAPCTADPVGAAGRA